MVILLVCLFVCFVAVISGYNRRTKPVDSLNEEEVDAYVRVRSSRVKLCVCFSGKSREE